MTSSPDREDRDQGRDAHLADLGERARADEDTPSSGPVHDATTDGGTAAGDPLGGVGSPDAEPAYPDGSEEDLDG